MSLKSALDRIRIDRGLSLPQLAAALGTTTKRLDSMIAGRVRPQRRTLARIARLAGISVGRLLKGEAQEANRLRQTIEITAKLAELMGIPVGTVTPMEGHPAAFAIQSEERSVGYIPTHYEKCMFAADRFVSTGWIQGSGVGPVSQHHILSSIQVMVRKELRRDGFGSAFSMQSVSDPSAVTITKGGEVFFAMGIVTIDKSKRDDGARAGMHQLLASVALGILQVGASPHMHRTISNRAQTATITIFSDHLPERLLVVENAKPKRPCPIFDMP